MLLELESGGLVHRAVGRIETDMVMCGGSWHAGIVVEGFDIWHDEVVAYAINEGRVLFDTIDGDGERPDVPWRVISVTSAELSELRLLGAKLPPGLKVITASGQTFIVAESGEISDGVTVFGSTADIAGEFVVEV